MQDSRTTIDQMEPASWLPIAASIPIGLCMMVLSLPSINDVSADWRRLLCLVMFLAFCVPLMIVQRALTRRHVHWLLLVASLLLLSYLLSLSSNAIDFLVSRFFGWIPDRPLELHRIVRGIDAFWLALIAFCALHAVVSYYAELGKERSRAASAIALAREAELRALRYQLQPHFLFNTFNAISSLVATGRNNDAQQMITRLADFLRATLNEQFRHEVALADEIALTETYLSIEKARLGDRLLLQWNIGPDVIGKCVPYLILQPLVENAIRHGVALRNKPGKLAIELQKIGVVLQISVINDGATKQQGAEKDAPSSMVGLQNIEERLVRLYGADHSLHVASYKDGSYRVDITLPLREFHENDPCQGIGQ